MLNGIPGARADPGGAGTCASLIALYHDPGDPAYGEMLDKFIAGMLT